MLISFYKNPCSILCKYWPSTEPSIKRFTCVNKRKNSGSWWTQENYITRCLRRFEPVGVSWRQDAELRANGWQSVCALSDPRLSNPSQDEGDVLLWLEELGSICSSLSPSQTHLSHTTNNNPFENKVWEIYFYKEVCSFVHWSRHYCWLCFRIYLYMHTYSICGYTTVIRYQLFLSNPNNLFTDLFIP